MVNSPPRDSTRSLIPSIPIFNLPFLYIDFVNIKSNPIISYVQMYLVFICIKLTDTFCAFACLVILVNASCITRYMTIASILWYFLVTQFIPEYYLKFCLLLVTLSNNQSGPQSAP